jgi:hypothetical protein
MEFPLELVDTALYRKKLFRNFRRTSPKTVEVGQQPLQSQRGSIIGGDQRPLPPWTRLNVLHPVDAPGSPSTIDLGGMATATHDRNMASPSPTQCASSS